MRMQNILYKFPQTFGERPHTMHNSCGAAKLNDFLSECTNCNILKITLKFRVGYLLQRQRCLEYSGSDFFLSSHHSFIWPRKTQDTDNCNPDHESCFNEIMFRDPWSEKDVPWRTTCLLSRPKEPAPFQWALRVLWTTNEAKYPTFTKKLTKTKFFE